MRTNKLITLLLLLVGMTASAQWDQYGLQVDVQGGSQLTGYTDQLGITETTNEFIGSLGVAYDFEDDGLKLGPELKVFMHQQTIDKGIAFWAGFFGNMGWDKLHFKTGISTDGQHVYGFGSDLQLWDFSPTTVTISALKMGTGKHAQYSYTSWALSAGIKFTFN